MGHSHKNSPGASQPNPTEKRHRLVNENFVVATKSEKYKHSTSESGNHHDWKYVQDAIVRLTATKANIIKNDLALSLKENFDTPLSLILYSAPSELSTIAEQEQDSYADSWGRLRSGWRFWRSAPTPG